MQTRLTTKVGKPFDDVITAFDDVIITGFRRHLPLSHDDVATLI